MILALVKYALVGYAAVKSGQYVARKVTEWRKPNETPAPENLN